MSGEAADRRWRAHLDDPPEGVTVGETPGGGLAIASGVRLGVGFLVQPYASWYSLTFPRCVLRCVVPPWHHHCGCPYHRRGRLCPWCDDPSYWPRTRDEWDEPRYPDVEPISEKLEGLREAIDRLTDRVEALEAE